MKIKSKTLLVTVVNEIKIGKNDAIEATVEHQIIGYDKEDGSVGVDTEFIDIYDVKFLGMPIDTGYAAYKRFKKQMLELGVNVDELVDKAVKGIVSKKEEFDVKKMFINLNNK